MTRFCDSSGRNVFHRTPQLFSPSSQMICLWTSWLKQQTKFMSTFINPHVTQLSRTLTPILKLTRLKPFLRGYRNWSSPSRALIATVVEALDAPLEVDVVPPGVRNVISVGTTTVLAMMQGIVDLVVTIRSHSTNRSRETSTPASDGDGCVWPILQSPTLRLRFLNQFELLG
ncbi:unnamed protein product [Dicrocoelium dendriticum]|nr:unnamed protein product [Dicrocoelium dendriticum]